MNFSQKFCNYCDKYKVYNILDLEKNMDKVVHVTTNGP